MFILGEEVQIVNNYLVIACNSLTKFSLRIIISSVSKTEYVLQSELLIELETQIL